ncbi:MAG: hypothetical protein JRJ84_25460 [Deltaproteobacteria bacterium]|nr:hypothetical protein [Deltaproteobacteria bacterium]
MLPLYDALVVAAPTGKRNQVEQALIAAGGRAAMEMGAPDFRMIVK